MSEIEALVICSNQVKYVKCCINIVDSPNEGIRNYEKNHQYSNTHLEKEEEAEREKELDWTGWFFHSREKLTHIKSSVLSIA